jgi:hypothetical protein
MTYSCTNPDCEWKGSTPSFQTFQSGEFRGLICPDCGSPTEYIVDEESVAITLKELVSKTWSVEEV